MIRTAIVHAFLLMLALPATALPQSGLDPQYQSYLAHIAAANGSLRLNEAGEAKRWLDAAPARHRGWEWSFLMAQCDVSLNARDFAETMPTQVSWSPDGSQIILPMSDSSIRFFDAETLIEDHRITVAQSTPYVACMSRNGLLAATYRGGLIRVWDVVSGDSVATISAGGHGIASVDMRPDGSEVAYSSWIRTDSGVTGIVSRWNTRTGEKVWGTEYGVKPIVVCRYSPDGTKLAVGTWDWRVAIWNLSSARDPIEFDFDDVPEYSAIDDIAWSPDGRFILSGTRNGTPRVWDVETHALRYELSGHKRPVGAVAFSPDGGRIYTAGDEGVINVWNTSNGRPLATVYGHTSEVKSIAVRARDGRLATYSSDGTLRLWDGNYGSAFSASDARGQFNYTLPMTSDGGLLASAGRGGSVNIWDKDGELVRNIEALDELVNDASFSPDGKFVGVVNWDSTVCILDVEAGAILKKLHGQDGGSSSCSFSADGRFFASGSTNQSLVIWETASGEVAHRIALPASAYRVEYSRDGKYLAAGLYNGNVALWNAHSLDSITTLTGPEGTIYNLDFSGDGWLLGAGSEDGNAYVWRLPAGDLFAMYSGHAGAVYDIAFHPDGDRVVTASADLTARMWDTKTGQSTLILSDFHDPVFNVVFSPDGSRLYISASGNDMLILDTVPYRTRLGLQAKE